MNDERPIIDDRVLIDAGRFTYNVSNIFIDGEGTTVIRLRDGNRHVGKTKEELYEKLDEGWSVEEKQ
ncbi:hypothetical protein [Natrinema sp. DC36]|uniref:hypothetical protein n=1 Tax=Natrinema sp. DC36 TaxID=2878680 RepID=UPI001CF09059|nr:hypothetical protein [Natrinema sp. DC36]